MLEHRGTLLALGLMALVASCTPDPSPSPSVDASTPDVGREDVATTDVVAIDTPAPLDAPVTDVVVVDAAAPDVPPVDRPDDRPSIVDVAITDVAAVDAGMSDVTAEDVADVPAIDLPAIDAPVADVTSPDSGSTMTAVAVAASHDHTCARFVDGSVRCWGANNFGQLGDGTTTQRTRPTAVTGSGSAVGLVAGYSHTCARLADGSIRCWGANSHGQLGDGTTTQRNSPVAVSGLTGALDVTVGGHTCARFMGGAVRCWGSNVYGEIGDGTTMPRNSPVAAGVTAAVGVAAGLAHTCAWFGDLLGSARCWGSGSWARRGDGPEQRAEELQGGVLEVVHALVEGDVLPEISLMDTTEHPKEVPQPGPVPLDGVGVDFPHAVAIVVPRPLFGEMVDGRVPRPVVEKKAVRVPLVRHHGRIAPCRRFDGRLKGFAGAPMRLL